MKVQLINLGRNKVNEIVYPADMKVLPEDNQQARVNHLLGVVTLWQGR